MQGGRGQNVPELPSSSLSPGVEALLGQNAVPWTGKQVVLNLQVAPCNGKVHHAIAD